MARPGSRFRQVLDAFSRLQESETAFCVFLVLGCILLYSNSLFGTFIWDDRAAVVNNADVHGKTPLHSLFYHDFWGANISDRSSHKSYRPLTVFTFRVDFLLYGLDATGYHATNLLIYTCCCLAVYVLFKQWMTTTIGAKIAVSLFLFHPVHVEAVSSIVGRADALCGLLYSCAVICYSESSLLLLQAGRAAEKSGFRKLSLVWTAVAYGFAFASSISKEIGLTVAFAFVDIRTMYSKCCGYWLAIVFAMFVAIDLFQGMRLEAMHESNKLSSGKWKKPSILRGTRQLLSGLLRCTQNASPLVAFLRCSLPIASALLIFYVRYKLHGEQQLYQWTMMENHVHLMERFHERVLSYAQYHFWYLFKLLYPRYLCFDYGLECIPTIHHLVDWRNLLPLGVYALLMILLCSSVARSRVALLIGTALLILPLLPALNIFVAVGTLLAERLLFVPSIGFCLIIGELCTVELQRTSENFSELIIASVCDMGTRIFRRRSAPPAAGTAAIAKHCSAPTSRTQHKHVSFSRPNKGNNKKSPKHTKLPSDEEKSDTEEKSPLKSALKRNFDHPPTQIAPKKTPNDTSDLKPKTNLVNMLLIPFLLILMGVRVFHRNSDWGSEHALFKSGLEVCPRSLKVLSNYALLSIAKEEYPEALDSALRAIDVFPTQIAALINAGIAYQRLGQFDRSIEYLKRAIEVDNNNAKAAGYLGHSLQLFSNQQTSPEIRDTIRNDALFWLERGIALGFDAPLMLFVAGSALLELNRYEESVLHYQAAITKSLEKESFLKKSSSVLKEDDISIPFAFNQIGNIYSTLRRAQEAIQAYEEGLKYDPNSIQILTNCGNLYREIGDMDNARRLMEKAISVKGDDDVPLALLNNLGLLELNVGNYARALQLFEQALSVHMAEEATEAQRHSLRSKRGESVSTDGNSVADVIRMNIRRTHDAVAQSNLAHSH